MRRFARCLFVAASVTAAAACSAEGDLGRCEEVAATFVLSAPTGDVELVPGGSVHVTWSAAAVPDVFLRFNLEGGDVLVPVDGADAAAGAIDLAHHADGSPIPSGIYLVSVTFLGCSHGEPMYRYEPRSMPRVYAQGVDFADQQLTFTGSQPTRELATTIVALSAIDVELYADPTPGVAGDELSFAREAVAGASSSIARRFTWTGMTTAGAAISGGGYRVIARVTSGAVVYDVTGPALTWTP